MGTTTVRTREGYAPNRVQVRITPGNPPKINQPSVILFVSENQEIMWECPANFEVSFKSESPFKGTKFDNANPLSGPPHRRI